MDAFNLLWSITGVAFIILIFVVLLCLLGFMTSAIAERRTAKAIESGLPEEAQGLLSDLTFQLSAHSTTQVDHILVAPHGIYVIEQKNYVGKLYGTLEESHWRNGLSPEPSSCRTRLSKTRGTSGLFSLLLRLENWNVSMSSS